MSPLEILKTAKNRGYIGKGLTYGAENQELSECLVYQLPSSL
ncbi:uncharacterized protein RAG0_04964 [Rhynchosporium agropyri]|uniref:Uncharacterized protein n=1 Tax=Rhynchosporium agropyri TaxID=914238 RepID=A0A1E1KAY0_9HELO|nr:uncharacterized protein RAG0_04964 [Rhynchosporium agropyri]